MQSCAVQFQPIQNEWAEFALHQKYFMHFFWKHMATGSHGTFVPCNPMHSLYDLLLRCHNFALIPLYRSHGQCDLITVRETGTEYRFPTQHSSVHRPEDCIIRGTHMLPQTWKCQRSTVTASISQ